MAGLVRAHERAPRNDTRASSTSLVSMVENQQLEANRRTAQLSLPDHSGPHAGKWLPAPQTATVGSLRLFANHLDRPKQAGGQQRRVSPVGLNVGEGVLGRTGLLIADQPIHPRVHDLDPDLIRAGL